MLRPCKSRKTTTMDLIRASPDKSSKTTAMDLISKLPDELLYSIFSCLKLRDIVKLSVLSNRFKHVCSSITHLRFDWDNMFVTDSLEISENPSCTMYKEKFVRGVNQFLQFYQGKQISSFEVSCCLDFECSNDIDQWLRFALSRGAEKVRLNLSGEKYCSKDKNGELIEGKYVLRKELFEGVKTNLKVLCLHACILGLNFTYQFSCLETLKLNQLPLSLYDLHGLFSCLLNLKKLMFFECNLPRKLCLGALTRLKTLIFASNVGLEVVDLSNANLLDFCCIRSHRVITCDFGAAPNLRKLWYSTANKQTFQYLFTCLPQHLPMLSKLSVISWFNWVEWVPKTISIFSKVTKLGLFFFQYPKFSILKLICILDAFPRLSTLDLTTSCPEDVDEEKLKPGEYVPKYLTEVVISGFYSTPNQMEFAIYLLKSAPVLRQLVIKPEAKPRVPKRQSWDEGEREMVYERLHEFAKNGVLVVQ